LTRTRPRNTTCYIAGPPLSSMIYLPYTSQTWSSVSSQSSVRETSTVRPCLSPLGIRHLAKAQLVLGAANPLPKTLADRSKAAPTVLTRLPARVHACMSRLRHFEVSLIMLPRGYGCNQPSLCGSASCQLPANSTSKVVLAWKHPAPRNQPSATRFLLCQVCSEVDYTCSSAGGGAVGEWVH
jgi:hypothetical protein